MSGKEKETEFINLDELLKPSRQYYTINQPKHDISKVIFKEKKEKDLSNVKLAKMIKELYKKGGDGSSTPHHNTLQVITSGGNYRIDNLLMLLDLLGKEIKIVDRDPEKEALLRKKEETVWKETN